MKGSANKAKEGNQLYFLHHILGPMQFYIAAHIDVEMIKLLLTPLTTAFSIRLLQQSSCSCCMWPTFNPHSVFLGHTAVRGARTKRAPSFVSFIVGCDGSNPACTTGRLKNNLSRATRNKRTKCPEGEISINVFLSFHRCKLDSSPRLACFGSVTLN